MAWGGGGVRRPWPPSIYPVPLCATAGNEKQCSRQPQCEVPCSVGNVVNSSLFINSSLSSLSSTSHAVHGGSVGGGSGHGGSGRRGGGVHGGREHFDSHNKSFPWPANSILTVEVWPPAGHLTTLDTPRASSEWIGSKSPVLGLFYIGHHRLWMQRQFQSSVRQP